jgi:hypothetical protein
MDIMAFFKEDCPLDQTKLGGNVGDPGEGGDGGEGGEPEGSGEPSGGTSPEDEQKAWEEKTEAELKHMQDVIRKMEDGLMAGNNEGLSAAWQYLINAANAAGSQGAGSGSGLLQQFGQSFFGVKLGGLLVGGGPSAAGTGGYGMIGGGGRVGNAHVYGGHTGGAYFYNGKLSIHVGAGLLLSFKPPWDSDSVQSACGKSGHGSGGLSGFFGGCILKQDSLEGDKPPPNPQDGGGKIDLQKGPQNKDPAPAMIGDDTCWNWWRWGGVVDPLPVDPGVGNQGGKKGGECDFSGPGGKPSTECCEENPTFPGCGGGLEPDPDPIYQEATSPKGDLY